MPANAPSPADDDELRLTPVPLLALCQEMAAMLALCPDGLVAFDRQGRLIHATPAFESLTRLPASQMQGIDEVQFWQVLSTRALPQTAHGARPAQTVASNPANASPQRWVLSQPVGRVLEVTPRDSDTGPLTKLLCFRDVTAQAERDQRRGAFMTTAGHELRNPLANITGFAEVLRSADNDEASRQEFTDIIYQQSLLMTKLLNDVLALSHIEARGRSDLVLSAVALPQLVQSVLDAFVVPDGRAVARLTQVEADLSAWADAKKLALAIEQVLSNAYKFSPAATAVHIHLERVASSPSGSVVVIHITDQGMGMSAEQQSHLGKRFYRADTAAKLPGSGLGMSLVKDIMDLLGGHLEVQSAVGQGSRVSLYCPAA
jgi:signal transduction histidine kinase